MLTGSHQQLFSTDKKRRFRLHSHNHPPYYLHFHRDLPDLFGACSHHPNSNIAIGIARHVKSFFSSHSSWLHSGMLFGQPGNTYANSRTATFCYFPPYYSLAGKKLSVWFATVLVWQTVLNIFSDSQTFWIICRTSSKRSCESESHKEADERVLKLRNDFQAL